MKKFLNYLLFVLLILVLWIGIDCYWPTKTSIRQFDPVTVADIDTKMWRSYYAKEPAKVFFELAALLRSQFDAPFWRSNIMAYDAARAAFVFKEGHNRNDYEKALPYLEKYYTQLHRLSKEDFNISNAARTELEWWIVHRDRKQFSYNDLAKALQNNAAAIYSVPDSLLSGYGIYRTKAMILRDDKAFAGGLTEQDWRTINGYLRLSWQDLHDVVARR
jgi:hypothetical protein